MGVRERCFLCGVIAVLGLLGCSMRQSAGAEEERPMREKAPICISGIYPHLAVFNGTYDAASGTREGTGRECGIATTR